MVEPDMVCVVAIPLVSGIRLLEIVATPVSEDVQSVAGSEVIFNVDVGDEKCAVAVNALVVETRLNAFVGDIVIYSSMAILNSY